MSLQNMGNKQKELEVLLWERDYNWIDITETWWDENHDWNIKTEGYNLFKRQRQIRKRGEVALYVKAVM